MPKSNLSANGYILLTGNGNPKLAHDIAKILKKPIYNPISYFSDGEIRVKVEPNMRRRHVYIIQPTAPPVNDRLMELVLMIDAVKRSSASEIIAVVPYFGYARQDRKEQSRVPISAAAVANMIEHRGADRILTIDLHAEQIAGFVRCSWDNLYGSYTLIPAIKAKKLQNIVVASPDKNGVARATAYANRLGATNIAIVYKERDLHVNDVSEALAFVGNVKGKNVLLVDDMISAGGTIINAANFLKANGAKTVYAVVTHGLFTGDALAKISTSSIDEIIVTDSVMHRKEVIDNPKITIVSVAPLLAEAMRRFQFGESVSSLFIK